MKKSSILLLCCFAASAHAMNDPKNPLLAQAKSLAESPNKDLLAESLLIGGLAISKIAGNVADPEYAIIARAIPLLPGLALMAYNLITDLNNN